jgi:hypothetical protein
VILIEEAEALNNEWESKEADVRAAGDDVDEPRLA